MVVENVIEVTILRVKGKLLKSKMIAAIINEKGPLQIKSKEKHNKIIEHHVCIFHKPISKLLLASEQYCVVILNISQITSNELILVKYICICI